MRLDYKKDWREYVLLLGSMTIFFILALYKLTDASLWLDETLEYYIGKTMTGYIPWYSNNGVTTTTNMYERMLGAFQPPLYNFSSYFWLLISDTEWWFRFYGVVMGAIGALGIYATVRRISNYYVASLSVLIYSCVYEIMYYTQECGEYIMLVMFLAWLLYWYIRAMEDHNTKNIICYVLFCILSIYTQYGAAFVIATTAISLMLRVWKDDRTEKSVKQKQFKVMIESFGVAVVGFALPLLFLFVIPQLKNQTNVIANPEAWNFYNDNVFSDIVHMFIDVFRWNLIESFTRFYALSLLATIVLLALGIFYCLKGKDIILKHLLVCNVFTWFLYYVPTRAGLYGRGYFGFRYNIFFIPVWLITFVYLFYRVYQMIAQTDSYNEIQTDKKEQIEIKQLSKTRDTLSKIYIVVMLLTAVGYCFYGSHQILKHWEKADLRGAVNTWYTEQGYEVDTLVEPAQVSSFSYYYEHDSGYENIYDKKVHRLVAPIADNIYYDNVELEQYKGYKAEIDEIFDGQWPDEIYCFVGDIENSPVADVVSDMGYQCEEVFRTTTQLYRFYR